MNNPFLATSSPDLAPKCAVIGHYSGLIIGSCSLSANQELMQNAEKSASLIFLPVHWDDHSPEKI